MISRRSLLEKWWLLPVAATVGTFGYMGWYAARVTFRKRRAGAPEFVTAAPQQVAELTALGAEWADVNFSYAGRPCTALRVPQPRGGRR